ncbi:MAG: DUF308 domain-containing protein [Bacteroidetes bacterium]|nr:DUF308 domain-containing protein [Bacteroidota bacterium]
MSGFLHSLTNTVKHWYLPLIIGILFILLGAYIMTVPLETYVTLSIFFSVSFFVTGLLEVVFSLQNSRSLQGWGWYLVSGLLSLAIGIYLMTYPGISMTILPFVIGFTLLFRSFQLLGIAFDLKSSKVLGWGNLAIASVLGIILSFLLIANPLFTMVSVVTLTALSFMMVGIAAIVLAFNLKKMKDLPNKLSKEAKDRIQELQNEISKLYHQQQP